MRGQSGASISHHKIAELALWLVVDVVRCVLEIPAVLLEVVTLGRRHAEVRITVREYRPPWIQGI
jgi:hypothetical protein